MCTYDIEVKAEYKLLISDSCLSWVPEQGTVGASGDLAPLSHLALGLIGDGKMWSPKTGWDDAKVVGVTTRIDRLCLLNDSSTATRSLG